MFERDGHCVVCGGEKKISHRGICEPCSKNQVVENIKKAREKKCQKKEKYEITPAKKTPEKKDETPPAPEPKKQERRGIW